MTTDLQETDELRLLRSARSDAELELDDTGVALGRARLERQIDELSRGGVSEATGGRVRRRVSGSGARPLRSRLALLGVGGAAAAALAVGGLVLNPIAPAPEAEAAEILMRASEQVAAEAPALAPGQYLRVEERATNMMTMLPEEGREFDGTIAYLFSETLVSYVPADRDGDWIVRRSGPAFGSMLTPLGDPSAERAATESAEENALDLAADEIWPAGNAPLTEDDLSNPDLETARAAQDARYRDAPEDAEALRDYIIEDVGPTEVSQNTSIIEWLVPVVSDPSLPAGLRSAGFEVLAGLDGAEVSDREVSVGGEPAVSVRVQNYDDEGLELVFDDEGRLARTESVLTRTSEYLPDVAVGTVIAASTFTSTVVDAIPDSEGW